MAFLLIGHSGAVLTSYTGPSLRRLHPGADFRRKGSPDAGVECFSILENDDAWGGRVPGSSLKQLS